MSKGTDFNDLMVEQGVSALKRCIDQQLAAIEADRQAETQEPAKLSKGYNPAEDYQPPPVQDGVSNWEDMLERNQYGDFKSSVRNMVLIFQFDPDWGGVIGYSEFSYQIIKRVKPPLPHSGAGEWEDADSSALRVWVSQQYGFTPNHQDIADALVVVGRSCAFHPVRDYLRSVKWDGVPRVECWLRSALGADDDERYLAAIGKRYLIGAVARVMRPGCKMDNVMILEGAQGAGKSTTAAVLFGEYFTDAPLPIGDKDAYQVIQGKWGFELAELDSFNKSETTTLKHFFSQCIDRFRPSYGRVAADHPRQVVFFGTTNQDTYLRDYTGNRRFWPVHCGRIDIGWMRDNRDQLWAEAAELYRQGTQWWVTDEERELVEDAQDARLERDPWEDDIIQFLATVGGPYVQGFQILKFLGFEDAYAKQPQHQKRIAPIMKVLGWRSERRRIEVAGGKRMQRRVYVNPEVAKEWEKYPL